MTPVERVVEALEAHGITPRRAGAGYRSRCPAHDDRAPSLSVGEGAEGRALVNCLAGCDTEAVLAELGLTYRDLFPKGGEWAA